MKNVSTEINQQIQNSFLMMMRNCANIKLNFYENNEIILNDEKIVSLIKKIFKNVSEVEDLMKQSISERESLIQELIQDKSQLATGYDCYLSYAGKLEVLLKSVQYYVYAKLPTEDVVVNTLEREMLIRKCIDFVSEDVSNILVVNKKLQEIFTAVPFKLTKQKYYDYVTAAVQNVFKACGKGELDGFIYLFKKSLLPDLTVNYGEYFAEIGNELSDISSREFWKMEEADLNVLKEKLTDIENQLTDVDLFFEESFEIINGLIIALTYGDNFDHITDNSLVNRDLFYSVREIVTGKEQFTIETVLEKADELIEKNVLKLEKLEKRVFKELGKLSREDVPEELSNSLDTMHKINRIYREHLSLFTINCFSDMQNANDSITKEYVDEKLEEFILFLRENLEKLNIKTQKLIKRFSLGIIPCSMGPEEATDYLKYALNDISKNDFLATQLMIEDVIEEFDEEMLDFKF